MGDHNDHAEDGPAFAHSSQRNHWMFTAAKLAGIRAQTHTKAVSRFESIHRKRSLTPNSIRRMSMSMGDSTPAAKENEFAKPTPDMMKRMSMGSTNDGAEAKRMSMTMSPNESTNPPMTPDSKSIVKTIQFGASPNGTPNGTPNGAATVTPIGTPNAEVSVPMRMTPASSAKPSGYLVPQEPERVIKKTDMLTLGDEATMRLYWEKFVFKIVTQLFPAERGRLLVMATALMYFKRFFMVNSVMNHNPRHIMVTCINVANKVEEWVGRSGVTLRKLAEVTKTKPERIVRLEVTLLDSIRFHLRLFHPYKPLRGHVQAIGKMIKEAGNDEWSEGVGEQLVVAANSLIQTAFFTDTMFLWFPSQIALAALLSVAQQQGHAQPVLAYIQGECAKACQHGSLHDQMMETLASIDSMLQQGATAIPDIEQAKVLDRKLKQFNKLVAKEAKQTLEKKRAAKEQKRLVKLRKKQIEREKAQASLLMSPELKRPTNSPGGESDDGGFTLSKRFKPTPER